MWIQFNFLSESFSVFLLIFETSSFIDFHSSIFLRDISSGYRLLFIITPPQMHMFISWNLYLSVKNTYSETKETPRTKKSKFLVHK